MSASPQAPRDPAFAERVRASFAKQQFMTTLGATLERVEAGEVEIALPFHARLTQQHGFLHAGAGVTAVDSACGYAALSLMEPGAAVLSVEFKVNLLEPATAPRFRAIGRVVRRGRTLTICTGELRAVHPEGERVILMMQATMMAVRDRAGLTD